MNLKEEIKLLERKVELLKQIEEAGNKIAKSNLPLPILYYPYIYYPPESYLYPPLTYPSVISTTDSTTTDYWKGANNV